MTNVYLFLVYICTYDQYALYFTYYNFVHIFFLHMYYINTLFYSFFVTCMQLP